MRYARISMNKFASVVVVFSALMMFIGAIEGVMFMTLIAAQLGSTGIGLNNAASCVVGFFVLGWAAKNEHIELMCKHPFIFQIVSVFMDIAFLMFLWTNIVGLLPALLVNASFGVASMTVWNKSKTALVNRCIIKDAQSKLSTKIQQWSTAGGCVGSLLAIVLPVTLTSLCVAILAEVIVGFIGGQIIIRKVLQFNKEKKVFEKWEE